MSQLNTFVPLSVFTTESVALILVITKDSGTIARKTGSLFVQFISWEISQATSSLTFLTRKSILETRDSILETRDSRLDTWNYRGSSIESQGSRIEARGTVNLLLSSTVYPLVPFSWKKWKISCLFWKTNSLKSLLRISATNKKAVLFGPGQWSQYFNTTYPHKFCWLQHVVHISKAILSGHVVTYCDIL